MNLTIVELQSASTMFPSEQQTYRKVHTRKLTASSTCGKGLRK